MGNSYWTLVARARSRPDNTTFYPLDSAMSHKNGSSTELVCNIWCCPDVLVNMHVNVNVPENGVTLADRLVYRTWLQSVSFS